LHLVSIPCAAIRVEIAQLIAPPERPYKFSQHDVARWSRYLEERAVLLKQSFHYSFGRATLEVITTNHSLHPQAVPLHLDEVKETREEILLGSPARLTTFRQMIDRR